MSGTALLLYGRGDELGKFSVFAKSLANELHAKKRKVVLRNIERKDAFFDCLRKPGNMISEVHVFAHSIGGGLFLAYGDTQAGTARIAAFDNAVKANRRITYDEVVGAEIGSVLTDDLVRPPYATMRTQIVANLLPGATVKLWGCNSAIRNWVYSDDGVVDPNDTNQPYYWRALNERNVPKPSIAKALAGFWGAQYSVPLAGRISKSDTRATGSLHPHIARFLATGHRAPCFIGSIQTKADTTLTRLRPPT